jgi:hypothetical protein
MASLPLSSQRPPTQSVEGVVIDRVTSQGIAGASLELTGIVDDRINSYFVKTGPEGRFVFANVTPSQGYWLVAAHAPDHVEVVYGQRGIDGSGTQIAVVSGQDVRGSRILMFPTGEISGRVLTRNGKAVGDAQVLAMQASIKEGAPYLRGVASFVRTNGRGEYHISKLAPGLYYLRVLAPNFGGMSLDTEGYPAIFFPGTSDESLAQPVPLAAGRRLTGVDVSVEKVHPRSVGGMAVDSTGTPIPGARILLTRQNSKAGAVPVQWMDSTKGTFAFKGVVPGSYFITAVANGPSAVLRGRAAVDVGLTDVENVRIPLAAGYDIEAKVEVEGAGERPEVSVLLKPEPPSSTGLLPAPTLLPAKVSGTASRTVEGILPSIDIPPVRVSSKQDSISMRNVSAWRYSVIVRQTMPDGYVASVRQDETDVTQNGLTVDGPTAAPLRIVIRRGAGVIAGKVLNEREKPMGYAQIVLIPANIRRARSESCYWMVTGAAGDFEFRNLPPGDYRAFPWEHIEEEQWLDPAFLDLYKEKGTPIHVREGAQETLQLHTIPPWY